MSHARNVLRARIAAYLRLCRAEGALYTADIAWGARDKRTFAQPTTAAVNRELRRMEKEGLVIRVLQGGQGRPASWRLA